MELIKKNITLAVILLVTIVISIGLVYMDFNSHSRVTSTIEEISKSQAELEKIYKQSPSPVEQNHKLILQDTEILTAKTRNLQRTFGKPYRNALLQFAKEMKLSEDVLIARFQKVCSGIKQSDNIDEDRRKAFEAFVKTFKETEQAQLLASIQNFCTNAQKSTYELISEDVGRDLFMQSLGLPRNMAKTFSCKTYLDAIQEAFVREKAIPGLPEQPGEALTAVKNMTYDAKSSVPPRDMIVTIMRRFQMYEDLFARMRQSKVTALKSLEKKDQLAFGERISSDYLKFSYKMQIVGSMDSLRNFVNLLQEANADNRIYLITFMSFQRVASDDVKTALTRVGTDSKPADAAAPAAGTVDPATQPGYGAPLVGANRDVTATISFDYIIYVGDEIEFKR